MFLLGRYMYLISRNNDYCIGRKKSRRFVTLYVCKHISDRKIYNVTIAQIYLSHTFFYFRSISLLKAIFCKKEMQETCHMAAANLHLYLLQ